MPPLPPRHPEPANVRYPPARRPPELLAEPVPTCLRERRGPAWTANPPAPRSSERSLCRRSITAILAIRSRATPCATPTCASAPAPRRDGPATRSHPRDHPGARPRPDAPGTGTPLRHQSRHAPRPGTGHPHADPANLANVPGLLPGAGVPVEHLEELRCLYAGAGDNLEQLIARLELRAGSSRELARRVGISPATLWEYRRGNFPLPLALLRQLCKTVGEDIVQAEVLCAPGRTPAPPRARLPRGAG